MTSSELNPNTEKINVSHNIKEPFKTIIDQIEMMADFSNAGKVPYKIEQFVNTAYDLIFVTGYFTTAWRWWNQRPEVNKNWLAFKSYFE